MHLLTTFCRIVDQKVASLYVRTWETETNVLIISNCLYLVILFIDQLTIFTTPGKQVRVSATDSLMTAAPFRSMKLKITTHM